MKRFCPHLIALFTLMPVFMACSNADSSNDSAPGGSDQQKLELPENALEGEPHSFHGTRTGTCTVKTVTGTLINNGFLRSEIQQTATGLNIQIFCAPHEHATSGYKLYTTGHLSIDGNDVTGPTLQSGRIGRKGLQLFLKPVNDLSYTIAASVGTKTRFQITAVHSERIVENMLGEF